MRSRECPSAESLIQYAIGNLSEAQASSLEAHFEDCADCLKCLDSLANSPDELVTALQRKPAHLLDESPLLADAVAAALAHAASSPARNALMPGDIIGGYRLVEEIGRGGMGCVYRARHPRLDQEVALKLVRPGLDLAQVLSRFEAERETLARMDHPNIARVVDGGADDQQPFFVMELVRGAPITRYCDEQHLDLRRRLELFASVCLAVHHAHQKGIIHRDIKPSNVLVAEYDGQPVPKVIDFGVAKALERRSNSDTEVGMLVGTLEYMSPEQADLSMRDIDTRSDIYALGVLLFELLTGDTPFERHKLRATPVLEVLRVIREQEPPAPSARLAQTESGATPVPSEALRIQPRFAHQPPNLQELDWIVLKALEKDRARRFDSAAALAQDVMHYLRDEPVSAGPPSRAYRMRKFIRRNRSAVLAASLILAALLTGAAGATTGMFRARKAERLAGERLDEALVEKAKATEERDATKEISDFLVYDLLGQTSTYKQRLFSDEIDPDIKLRTALDRAAKLDEGRFSDHPRVEAKLRSAIGRTYNRLGDFASARSHLQRAWELVQQHFGPEEQEYVEVIFNLAQAYEGLKLYALASPHYADVVQRVSRLFGAESGEALESRFRQARFMAYSGRLADGETLLTALLEDSRRIAGPEDRLTLRVESHLGWTLTRRRRLDQAEPLLVHAYESHLSLFGRDSSTTWIHLMHLAEHNAARNRLEKAEEQYRQVVEDRRRLLAAGHPQTLHAEFELGRLLVRRGKLSAARPFLSEAFEGRRRLLGAGHADTLFAQIALGNWHARNKEFDDAEKVLTDALNTARRSGGPDDLATCDALNALAHLHDARGRYPLAEPLFREALASLRRMSNPSPVLFHAAFINCAANLLRQNKLAEAEPILKEYLDTAGNRGWKDIRIGIARSELGEILMNLKRDSEAEPFLLAGFDEIRAHAGEVSAAAARARLAEAAQRLARYYGVEGKPDEASKWRDKAIELLKP